MADDLKEIESLPPEEQRMLREDEIEHLMERFGYGRRAAEQEFNRRIQEQ